MTEKPTAFVLEYAPWSISKADVAKQCPHRFYLQYVKKLKLDDVGPNTDALVGQAVHKLLEYALAGTSMEQALTAVINSYALTTNELNRVKSFEAAANQFIDRFRTYREKHHCGAPVLEQKLAIHLDGSPAEFFDNTCFLRGVIDVYALMQNKPHAVIIDHKTGKEHALDYYEVQFQSYMALLKAKIPSLTGIITGINFLQESAIELKNDGRLTPVPEIEPILDRLVTYLNRATELTHKFDFCKTGPLCNWCDYQTVCPGVTNGRQAG